MIGQETNLQVRKGRIMAALPAQHLVVTVPWYTTASIGYTRSW
jgi:hypothetical protein